MILCNKNIDTSGIINVCNNATVHTQWLPLGYPVPGNAQYQHKDLVYDYYYMAFNLSKALFYIHIFELIAVLTSTQ